MANRIKGQEVAISVVVDGELDTKITTIQTASFEFMLDQSEESYLGEGSSRYDSTFKGIKIELEGHMESAQVLRVADAIVNRAKRRAGAATQIDISATLVYPDGDLVTLLASDVAFESVPVNAGSREEFVSVKLTGAASQYKLIE